MPILIVLLIVVPIAELWVIVETAERIGVVPTLLTLLAVSIVGGWLLKREGTSTWRKLRATMARGEIPTNEATDGALILMGGALLLTPGFLTDIVGLGLVFPATRALIRRYARRVIGWMAAKRFGARGYAARQVYETRARRVRSSHEGVSPPASPSPRLSPGGAPPDGADGSRGRG
jgi:UPF0716 protein FxsA